MHEGATQDPPPTKSFSSHLGRLLETLLPAIPWLAAGYLASFLSAVSHEKTFSFAWDWVPSLGIQLSFHLDGLSLLFGLLISGMGGLILAYAPGYFSGHPDRGRVYFWLLLFMGAMLGLVLANNIITLFIFWELTGITSYMLIGFKHESEKARGAALQALLVTGMGGLALLAGLLLLGHAGGSYELTHLLTQKETLQSHPLLTPIVLLILLGAFTKSAQFPFHFWLPGAMEAPTPVSAYLHSATMVKAGVYLVARLTPALGGAAIWDQSVFWAGVATALTGGVLALRETDLKRLLAYSTVASLGVLMLLLTLHEPLAAVLFLLCHSLYKGGLFLVAGAVDHSAGTRDVRDLGGLFGFLPWVSAAAILGALSMAGLPPAGGFLAKESVYETSLHLGGLAGWGTTAALFAANVSFVTVAAWVAIGPFFGGQERLKGTPHRANWRLAIPPLLLGLLGLSIGLAPGWFAKSLVGPAVAAIDPHAHEVHLKLWHGFHLPLLLSLITLAAGAAVYALHAKWQDFGQRLQGLDRWGPAAGYQTALWTLKKTAAWQTQVLQNGRLRLYLLVILTAFMMIAGMELFQHLEVPDHIQWSKIEIYEWFIPALILGSILIAIRTSSRLAAVSALGVIGYAIAMLFVMFGAPDLAMTQMAIETLSVVLFVFVIYRLPRFTELSSGWSRTRDAVAAIAGGCVMTAIVLAATFSRAPSHLAQFFVDNSYTQAKGHNMVNVILVDFRGLDTLGEITVLSIAALGVFSLLKLRPKTEEPAPVLTNDSQILTQGEMERLLAEELAAEIKAAPGIPRKTESLILSTATRYLLPLLLLFSIFLLLRGHNEPGGGFVGGLTAAAAFALYAITFGVKPTRRMLGVRPRTLLGVGLAIAASAGLVALAFGEQYMTGVWSPVAIPAIGKIGTPLVFDIGVYLVVVGMVLMIVFELAEN